MMGEKMLDTRNVLEAQAQKVCFICSMCVKWHEGRERGIKNELGDIVCTTGGACCGPMGGGSFHLYEGPLENFKYKQCFLCGVDATHWIWAKGNEHDKIGLCEKHISTVRQYTIRKGLNGFSILVSEKRAGPDKFEVME